MAGIAKNNVRNHYSTLSLSDSNLSRTAALSQFCQISVRYSPGRTPLLPPHRSGYLFGATFWTNTYNLYQVLSYSLPIYPIPISVQHGGSTLFRLIISIQIRTTVN